MSRRCLILGLVTGFLVWVLFSDIRRQVKLVAGLLCSGWNENWRTLHDRKIDQYGDRTGFGYGYLLEIVQEMPPGTFPRVRYSDFDRPVQLLFPERSEIEERIVIGIGINATDLKESVIAQAILKEGSGPQKWIFRTDRDCDTMTGIRFRTDSKLARSSVKATLYQSPRNLDVLAEIRGDIETNLTLPLVLKKEIREFSHGRGATDFLLEIEGVSLSELEILGIRVDLSGIELVHRESGERGDCFTGIFGPPPQSSAWRAWVEKWCKPE